jgi:hypothetical protein
MTGNWQGVRSRIACRTMDDQQAGPDNQSIANIKFSRKEAEQDTKTVRSHRYRQNILKRMAK